MGRSKLPRLLLMDKLPLLKRSKAVCSSDKIYEPYNPIDCLNMHRSAMFYIPPYYGKIIFYISVSFLGMFWIDGSKRVYCR